MATAGQLTVNLLGNASQFRSEMDAARETVNQMTTVVQLQDQTWRSLAGSVLSSLASITGPVISLYSAYKRIQAATLEMAVANAIATPPTLTLGAAVNFLLSPVVLTAAAIALLAGTIYYFSGAANDASDSLKKTGSAAKETQDDLSALQSVQESFMAGFIGTTGLDALTDLSVAGEELKAAFSDLGDTILQPLRDAGFEIGSVAELFTGFTAKVRLATDVVRTLTSLVQQTADVAKDAVAQATLLGTMFATGMNAEQAGELIAAREAERAAAVEAFQAQKAENFAVAELKKLTEAATEAAEHRSEVSRIGRIVSLESLDEESKALEANIAALKRSGKFTEDARKQIEELAGAIANQRQGILDGTVVDKAAQEAQRKAEETRKSIESMIASAARARDELKFGKTESTLAEADRRGANEEESARLRAILEETDQINAIKKAREEAAKEEEKRIREQQQEMERLKRSAEQIADAVKTPGEKLAEQLEKIRELESAGLLSPEMAERARQKAQQDAFKSPTADAKTGADTALAGSREAAQSIVRAMNPRNLNKKLEDLMQQAVGHLGNIAGKDGGDDGDVANF